MLLIKINVRAISSCFPKLLHLSYWNEKGGKKKKEEKKEKCFKFGVTVSLPEGSLIMTASLRFNVAICFEKNAANLNPQGKLKFTSMHFNGIFA